MTREQDNDIDQDPYAAYDISSFLKQAVLRDSVQRQEDRVQRKTKLDEVLKIAWGENAKASFFIAPSTAANCLRWIGYESLGYKAAPKTFKLEMQSMMGSAAHWSLTKKLDSYGPQEYEFVIDKPGISGRIDSLLKNPLTEEWQVIDFKFVGSYVFKSIKREGLTPELKINKKNYNPGVEARKQILLYMWAESKRGMDVACGNIVYINRDSGDMKSCIVPWGPKEQNETNLFIEKINSAKENILKKELPEPSVESPHVCKSFCPYIVYCDHGKEFAKGKARKESKKMPSWLKEQIKLDKEKKDREMENLGINQPKLIPDQMFEVNSKTPQLKVDIGSNDVNEQNAKQETSQPVENIQNVEKEIYYRGDHELSITCDQCPTRLIRTVLFIEDTISRNKPKKLISVEDNCPHHGSITYWGRIKVDPDQLIDNS
jgi:hypothetical protein